MYEKESWKNGSCYCGYGSRNQYDGISGKAVERLMI